MATPIPPQQRPDVLLLIASGCAICPVVHKILSQLNTEGKLGRLEVIDIAQRPELASHYGVRSVPWFRIGELEFQGIHNATELDYWASHALSNEGIQKYLIEELEAGHLHSILKLIRLHPQWLRIALDIVSDLETPIQARIGLGAVFEDLKGDPRLKELVPDLAELTRHADQQVRADACYYLGLSGSLEAKPALKHCITDTDPDVREIAQEALADLPD